MKYFDFDKVKDKIESYKESLESADLGMHEDWFWTATPIWENGNYTRTILSNKDAVKLHEEYIEARQNGMSILDEGINKYEDCLIGGIMGSSWATPTLQLIFKDGSEDMIDVSYGDFEKSEYERNIEQSQWVSGPLSSELQKNIKPLKKDKKFIKK
jgi:hypothetical protein